MRKRQIMAAANDAGHPITDTLGPKQQQALDGPLGPSMSYFECVACKKRFMDTSLYFFEVKSSKCLWCSKFPKVKNAR